MSKKLKHTVRSLIDYLPNRMHERQRSRDLSAERVHYSEQDLRADLDKVPVPRGATVLVHSSLKAIGYVEGGPATVVNALIDSVVTLREGTLLFPTYSINGTMYQTLKEAATSQQVVFDAIKTPSNLGAIPEAFRKHPDAVRSVHPTHSFAAIGPEAKRLVATHHTCGSNFGRGSPMAEILDGSGWLLGLGTNLGNVTLYHCVEEIETDFPFNVYTNDSPFDVKCRDADRNVHVMRLGAHDSRVSRTRIDRPENAAIRNFYTQWFEQHADMQWHTVCEARSWFISAKRLYDEAAKLMRSGITIYTSEAQLAERSNA